MSKIACFLTISILAMLVANCTYTPDNSPPPTDPYDVVVYGGTSAGVIAAVSASRMGKSVLLISPEVHLGGLSSGGLGATDVGNKQAFTGGLALEFYRRLGKYYGTLEAWRFEPHKAEEVFDNYIKEEKIKVLHQHRVISGNKQGTVLASITLEAFGDSAGQPNRIIKGRQFVDCTYEGDLLPIAGVSYTVGREGNQQYNETVNGFQMHKQHQFPDSISPYVEPGNPESGLLWGISNAPVRPAGTADTCVQAYNFRLCLTKDTNNQVAFYKPDNYHPEWYALYARYIKHKEDRFPKEWKTLHWNYFRIVEMPNGKTDFNNKGGFSTDMIGANHQYPDGDYATRDSIWQLHEDYVKGLLYFLATDKSIDSGLQSEFNEWGYAADEFTDNKNFPYALYVREGRRLVSDFVMTENHVLRKKPVNDTIAFGAYQMDSHNCQRLVVNGFVKNEGDVQHKVPHPYPIPLGVVLPKANQCTNLTVPVAVSASHIAFGTIRMEPVFMALAQMATMASVNALNANKTVQQVDGRQLFAQFKKDPLLNGTPPDIIIDNTDTTQYAKHGHWQQSSNKGHHLEWNRYGGTYTFTDAPNHSITIPLPKEYKSYKLYAFCTKELENEKAQVIVSQNTGEPLDTLKATDNPGQWIGGVTVKAAQGQVVLSSGANGGWFDAVLLQPMP